MSLSTLTEIKAHLGISGSTEDARLTAWLRGTNAMVRRMANSWLYGLISANSLANPTIVTMIGHGLTTGETVVITGSNSTPTIDGERVVTVLTADTFSVPVNVTVAGTAGLVARRITEYHGGDGTQQICLRQTPVQSINSLYYDEGGYYGSSPDPFPAATLLTDGVHYALRRDSIDSPSDSDSGIVERIGTVWGARSERTFRGLLAASTAPGQGNIKVTYTAGFRVVPYDLQLAVHRAVAEIRMTSESGGGMQSESLDYYSYTRLSAVEEAAAMTSVRGLLKRFKKWVF